MSQDQHKHRGPGVPLWKHKPYAVPAGIIAALLVVALVVVVLVLQRPPGPGGPDGQPTGDAQPQPTESPVPTTPTPGSSAPPTECPAATVTVSTAEQLQSALDNAAAGTVIQLEPGTYEGPFVATTSGTTNAPIALCGSADTVLDGGGIKEGYVLHLDQVSNWVLNGFSVQNGQKGVMADGTTNSLIHGLTVSEIGDEGIHLRNFSTDNTVDGNTISETGLRKPKYGEGIYVGTAESNWCDVSDCRPDASDRNRITGNTISDTSSESIDLKEGTTGGLVSGNTFDGSSISAADSWMDVKGNDYLITGNSGVNSPGDGFQTHEILDGWGTGNVFSNNSAAVNGPGVGYSLNPESGNIIGCDNSVSGAGKGLTNTDCRTYTE